MEKIKLHQLVGESPWTGRQLLDFSAKQEEICDSAKAVFKRIIEEEIKVTLRYLYKNVSTRLKECKEIDESENSKTLQELKNKSMFKLKVEKKIRRKLIKMAMIGHRNV